jgi:hypothetical protein
VSSENVETVRSIMAEWERGDFSSAEWADPEVEFIRADGPAPGRWTGPAGLPEATRELLDAWVEMRTKVEEIRALDPERVLVLIRLSGRARSSGVTLDQMAAQGAQLFELRDGKVTRLVHWFDRTRAFADLGLGPPDPD